MYCDKQIMHLVDKKFHDTWKGAKKRIYNPNYQFFDRYGGRGLTCDYDYFIDFYDDLWDSYVEAVNTYGKENVTIDRIDNDLGYVKGNIRWATRNMQQDNTSKIRRILGISPHDEIYALGNMQRFAERFPEEKLTSSGIQAVCSGRYRYTGNGWIFCYMDDLSRYVQRVDENGNPIPDTSTDNK